MKYRSFCVLSLALILSACNSIPSHEKSTSSGETLYYRGVQYLSGHGVQRDEDKALQYFKVASEKGYPAANNALAVMYDEGIAVKADKKLALKYYEQAVSSNEASAQYNLAAFYYENDPTNPKLQQYLDLAIDQKDSDALNLQARIQYQNGDYRKAYRSFTQSAKLNNPDALYYLYLMTNAGQGTTKNPTKAMSYLKKAAKHNQVNALYSLGTMYLQGDGVHKNTTQAFTNLDQAAKLGHTKAMVNLAIMYSKGEGVDQSEQRATYFFKRAAAQGDQQAIAILKAANKS